MTNQTTDEAALDIPPLPSSGDVPFALLRALVSEANCGVREDRGTGSPVIYPGHDIVHGINYNSLNRIVTGYARAQLTAATGRAEQAERMLAEVREALRKNVSISDARDLESGDVIGKQVNVLFPSGTEAKIETLWPILATIRSAASGEQG